MNRHWALILATCFFLFTVWKTCQSTQEEENAVPAPPAETVDAPNPQPSMEEPENDPENADGAAMMRPAPADEVLNEDFLRARFAAALPALGACLGFAVPPQGESVDATLENWINAVRTDLGDPILRTEDWNVADLRTPQGELRRIRIEMDYSESDRVVRRLKYYNVKENEEMEPIPLDEQSSAEPTETFVASLEADGEVLKRERSERLYFAAGEEIVVNERDGRIEEIDMTRGGRTFHCKPADPSPEACRCQ